MSANVTVDHDSAHRRFTAKVDGYDCELDYQLDGKVMVITHTGVPQPVGGRGIASALTAAAAAWARQEGLTIYPACSYAAAWFKRHPAEADLVARL
jgi:predicted GNAT family acetyltransferase